MIDNRKLKNYDDLPLVLDVSDIRRIMEISKVSTYELVHTLGLESVLPIRQEGGNYGEHIWIYPSQQP